MKDSVHRLLLDQIEMLKLTGFSATDTEIRHKNGGRFLFDGLRSNIEKIKSLEGIDRCWVEEAERVSERSWSVLLPTIRAPGSEIWVTFNPYMDIDPTYKRFVLSTPPRTWRSFSTYRDNPWISEEILSDVDHMRRVDPDAASHIYDGECLTHSESQVLFGKWSIDDFVAAEAWEGPYYGADWGFSRDPTVLVRCWVHLSTLYVDYAEYGVHVDIDQTPKLFDRVPNARNYMIRADGAWPQTLDAVAKRGFSITAAPKWPGSVEDGIAHLRSYDKIVIHDRCRQLAEEARLWRYKTDEMSGDIMTKLVDGFDHGWDAIRYALAPRIKGMPVAWLA